MIVFKSQHKIQRRERERKKERHMCTNKVTPLLMKICVFRPPPPRFAVALNHVILARVSLLCFSNRIFVVEK